MLRWNCSFSLVLVLGSLFCLHSRVGTRPHYTGLIWQACRLRQGDKGMQRGFVSTWSMQLHAIATSCHLENLWTWVIHTMRPRDVFGRTWRKPLPLLNQVAKHHGKAEGIWAFGWYFGLPLCRCLVWNIRIQLWFGSGTGFVSPDDLPQSDEEDEDQAKANIF